MWPLKKRINLTDSGFFTGFTDWHSHILPGVDDGVRRMEESLEILSLYERLGIAAVWLTPHIMEDVPNTTDHLRERFAELQAAYTGSIELRLAAENMLDNLFEQRLEEGDLLPLGDGGDHLLVETSYFNPPMRFYDILERIKAKGYHPVLAHPERYVYMGTTEYRKLKDMGVKFQLNLSSVAGMYGPSAQKKAEKLLKTHCYDLIGTDIHRVGMVQSLSEMKSQHNLREIYA
jgi:tyrosine-protein phosphatase YwqE